MIIIDKVSSSHFLSFGFTLICFFLNSNHVYGSKRIFLDNDVKSQVEKYTNFEKILETPGKNICFFGVNTKKTQFLYGLNRNVDDRAQGIGICDEKECIFATVGEESFVVLSEYETRCERTESIDSLTVKTNPYGIRYLDIKGDR